ncbi:MAG TPA: (2Fe-2S)-binding protein [Cytophagales bacterium]|nr:(2Fe-2S)-binding protein [Cytophagales bacterium]
MELTVNGIKHQIKSDSKTSLLNVIREELNMTGSKYGCGEGVCGSCTVLLDGNAVRSCIVEAGEASGKQITTIEGVSESEKLHPVQQSFLKEDVFQCGYCAPGMVMSAVGLLKKNASPSEEEIIEAMNGNICRCGEYPKIVKAIQQVSQG